MHLLDHHAVLLSPSDLTTAATCEFAFLRDLDGRLGRSEPLTEPADAMLARAAVLGMAHERRVLDAYIAEFSEARPSSDPLAPNAVGGVLVLERPGAGTEALAAAINATLAALVRGIDVVAQGAVGDGRFAGFADFLIKQPDGDGGHSYVVEDTKLARRAKVPALIQIAAYADLLAAAGVPIAPVARLRLGSGDVMEYRLDDIVPVYRVRRARLEAVVDEHLADDGAVAWGDERYSACGVCPACEVEVVANRDLRLVAGMRGTQRAKLMSVGIRTIDALAASTDEVPGMSTRTLENLRSQARLQVRSSQADGVGEHSNVEIPTEVFDPAPIQSLPEPSSGDLFFDFEGDPLWTGDDHADWGLEYLFGMLDTAGHFTHLWSDDRAAEQRALAAFFTRVRELRAAHPDMHIYHYAPYEVTALKRLVVTHQIGEDYLDELLRGNVFVDLYSVVRRSVRVGQPSYSIKKLEPLYMGDQLRTGEVTNAADSIAEYALYCAAAEAGDTVKAERKRRDILDYNSYDCLSTLKLRDWLRAQVSGLPKQSLESQVDADPDAGDPTVTDEEFSPLEILLAYAEPGAVSRTPKQQAAAMMHAAAEFHRRENRPFWWGHFDRLQTALDEWPESREAMVIDDAKVVRNWYREGRQIKERRDVEVRGAIPTGSDLLDGKVGYSVYAQPVPATAQTCAPDSMGTLDVAATKVLDPGDEDGIARLLVTELASEEFYGKLPVALTVGGPPNTKNLVDAIKEAAMSVALEWPDPEPTAAWDILRRTPPRTVDGDPLDPVMDHDFVTAITAAVRRLDHSYLAVQGPPGTGKTYTGARVITTLVEGGWKVGVVAQSHAVVENMLRGVVGAGLDPAKVGKRAGRTNPPWQVLTSPKDFRAFLGGGHSRSDGVLLGGTAWDFSNTNRVQRGELDLLVIDEAGQFSLANTIACGVSARSLLLLGDPQQLPQVSQGTHPEPVDESALGWLSDGKTLDPAFGYFLDQTYRMHPNLVGPVSKHSYEGKLTAHPVTAQRAMTAADGSPVAPGVQERMVDHRGNSVESREEAAAVVAEVRRALTWTWHDAAPDQVREPRRMMPNDVLVVVPYNAQRGLIRHLLNEAGFDGVRVGTVDKFQGQEAPVVIVSTTVSAAADAPRGMGFVLSRNRVNVAVSRGQWLAVVVRSAALTDYLPATPDGLLELGAFVGLCGSESQFQPSESHARVGAA